MDKTSCIIQMKCSSKDEKIDSLQKTILSLRNEMQENYTNEKATSLTTEPNSELILR